MNAKTKLEYSVTIRTGSGDTCPVQYNGANRFFIGAVHVNEDEIPEFLSTLAQALKESKALRENKTPA